MGTTIYDGDIIIRLVKLPNTIKGFTSPSFDGVYNVYINKNLPAGIQNEAIRHEVEHIKNNDFQSNLAVSELESN